MKINGVTLDAKKVRETRHEYYRKKSGRRPAVPFDQLLELFADERNTFASIARECGVSQQAVHQRWQSTFKRLIGFHGTAKRRRRAHAVRRKRHAVESARHHCSLPPAAQAVKDAAKAHGVKVLPIVRGVQTSQVHPAPRDLWVGGKRGIVYTARKSSAVDPKSGRRYYRVWLAAGRLQVASFVFFVLSSRKLVLVIDASTLRAVGNGRDEFPVFIPLKNKKRKQGPAGRIDWWKFENAWHLLKEG